MNTDIIHLQNAHQSSLAASTSKTTATIDKPTVTVWHEQIEHVK